jgi:hypothetical protein
MVGRWWLAWRSWVAGRDREVTVILSLWGRSHGEGLNIGGVKLRCPISKRETLITT